MPQDVPAQSMPNHVVGYPSRGESKCMLVDQGGPVTTKNTEANYLTPAVGDCHGNGAVERKQGNHEEPAAVSRDASTATAAKVVIRFLGTGDNFGSGGRLQACIYVDTGTSRFLIDCGASSLIAMKRAGISSAEIDAILISHLHGDHFGGFARRLMLRLPPLLCGPLQQLPVLSPRHPIHV